MEIIGNPAHSAKLTVSHGSMFTYKLPQGYTLKKNNQGTESGAKNLPYFALVSP